MNPLGLILPETAAPPTGQPVQTGSFDNGDQSDGVFSRLATAEEPGAEAPMSASEPGSAEPPPDLSTFAFPPEDSTESAAPAPPGPRPGGDTPEPLQVPALPVAETASLPVSDAELELGKTPQPPSTPILPNAAPPERQAAAGVEAKVPSARAELSMAPRIETDEAAQSPRTAIPSGDLNEPEIKTIAPRGIASPDTPEKPAVSGEGPTRGADRPTTSPGANPPLPSLADRWQSNRPGIAATRPRCLASRLEPGRAAAFVHCGGTSHRARTRPDSAVTNNRGRGCRRER